MPVPRKHCSCDLRLGTATAKTTGCCSYCNFDENLHDIGDVKYVVFPELTNNLARKLVYELIIVTEKDRLLVN